MSRSKTNSVSTQWPDIKDGHSTLFGTWPYENMTKYLFKMHKWLDEQYSFRCTFCLHKCYFFLLKFCSRSKKVTLMDVSPSNNLQLPMQSVPITTNVVSLNIAMRCVRYNIVWYKFISDLQQICGFLCVLSVCFLHQ